LKIETKAENGMNKLNQSIWLLTFAVGCLTSCWSSGFAVGQTYPNSIVSTDFDFIRESDPSVFTLLTFVEKRRAEMPDKRPGKNGLFKSAFVFSAAFSDGTSVDLMIDEGFETEKAAKAEALRYTTRLGRIPTILRKGVNRVVVHQGGKDTTAFSDIGLIVVYSANATKRISTHDLEETLFHESVHAAWDKEHARSDRWRKAQSSDGGFVTSYAKRNPDGEDLAESALFAYTLVHHPDRIPSGEAQKIKKRMPARIRFVADLIPPNHPIFYDVEEQASTNGSPITDREIQDEPVDRPTENCKIDISITGQFSDILSNALVDGMKKDEKQVSDFLSKMKTQNITSQQLFQLACKEFQLKENELKRTIKEFLHCNCGHQKNAESDKRAKEILDAWKLSLETDSKIE
jgi:hypothetical protein